MAGRPGHTELSRPEWFAAFLADRGTRKTSAHTMKAYRQDFNAIATLVVGDAAAVARMPSADITTDSMRTAFAQYAETHEAASIQRCWSIWNVLCTFPNTSDLIAANPMPLVGRPKSAKTLPTPHTPATRCGWRLCAPVSRSTSAPGICPFGRVGQARHWWRRATVTAAGAVTFDDDDGSMLLAENGAVTMSMSAIGHNCPVPQAISLARIPPV